MYDPSRFQAQLALMVALMAFLGVAGVWTAARSRFWRRLSWRELAALAGLVVLAAIARSFVEPFVANYQLSTVQGVYFGEGHRWAAGFAALVHGLFAVFPRGLATLSATNVVISLATIPLVYAFVFVAFEDRLAAFAAAAVVAFHPVLVRYAASDSPHVMLAFCLVAGSFFVVLWSRDDRRLLVLQGAGWLGLAANVRSEAVTYMAVGALIAAGWTSTLSRRRLVHACGAVIFFAAVAFQPLCEVLNEIIRHEIHDRGEPLALFEAFFLSSRSPGLLGFMAALGVVATAWFRPRPALLLLAAMWIVSLPTGYCVGECAECQEIAFRHLQPHFVEWSLFTGLGFSAAWTWLAAAYRRVRHHGAPSTGTPTTWTPWAAAALATIIALTCATRVPFLSKRWTVSQEYAFLARHIPDIPDRCTLIGVQIDEMAGPRLNRDISVDAGRSHEWIAGDMVDDIDGMLAAGECVVFYRGSICHAYEACVYPQGLTWGDPERPKCAEILDRYDAEPIATITLPAVPYSCEVYTADPVPIGLYVLRPK